MLHEYALKKIVEEKYSEPRMKIKGSWGVFGGRLDTVYEKDLVEVKSELVDTGCCAVCMKDKDYWWHDLNFQFIKPASYRHQWENDWAEFQNII